MPEPRLPMNLRNITMSDSVLRGMRPDPSRIEGMLLGLALGDSLGNTSESLTPAIRRARYGEITDFLPNRYANEMRIGLPSDDTQLSFWTVESILERQCLDPDDLARKFTSRPIFGLGGTVRRFIRNYKSGKAWFEAGEDSAGNGALMRVAPLILPSLLYPGSNLLRDLYFGSILTHANSASAVSCIAFGIMLRELLVASSPPPTDWWASRFIEIARQVEVEFPQRHAPRDPLIPYPEGTMSEWVERTVAPTLAQNLPASEACDRWHSGAYLPETVPSVLYILSRHGADPETAIIRAVNDTKDNDTVAAIVGSAVGALHGSGSLSDRWKHALSGRVGPTGDGTVQALIVQVLANFTSEP